MGNSDDDTEDVTTPSAETLPGLPVSAGSDDSVTRRPEDQVVSTA
jgi:hypothetical protein